MEQDELCGGAVRLTFETGPEFHLTDSISAKLDRIQELFTEIGDEVADDVAGFGYAPNPDPGAGLGSWSFRASGIPGGNTRSIYNEYGCHCKTN